jgi:hypothetical protein
MNTQRYCAQCAEARTSAGPCECGLVNDPIPMTPSTRGRIHRLYRASEARQTQWATAAAQRIADIGLAAYEVELQENLDDLFK